MEQATTNPTETTTAFAYKGKYYDISKLNNDELGLIQNIDIVQQEINRLKTSMDISQLALITLVERLDAVLASENNNFVEIDVKFPDQEETSETIENNEKENTND
jgi:DNA-directed RNA polymerase specialized sigma subunit